MSQEIEAYHEWPFCLESQLTVFGNLPYHIQLGWEEVLLEGELVLEEAGHQSRPSTPQRGIDLEGKTRKHHRVIHTKTQQNLTKKQEIHNRRKSYMNTIDILLSALNFWFDIITTYHNSISKEYLKSWPFICFPQKVRPTQKGRDGQRRTERESEWAIFHSLDHSPGCPTSRAEAGLSQELHPGLQRWQGPKDSATFTAFPGH